MTSDPMTTGQHYATPIGSPLYRQGPWLSDSRIIGHVTHPIISRLITLAPHNGVWTIGPDGGTRRDDLPVDLAALVTRSAEAAMTCTLGTTPDAIHRYAEVEDVKRVPLHATLVDVIAANGRLRSFDASLLHMGLIGKPDSFGLVIGEDGSSTLVMFDRKRRPRFLCAATAQRVPDET